MQDFSWKLKHVLKGSCWICTSPKSLFPATSQGCSWYNSLRFYKTEISESKTWQKSGWISTGWWFLIAKPSQWIFLWSSNCTIQPHTPIPVAKLIPTHEKDAWSPNPVMCSGFFPVSSKLGAKFPSGKWNWKCIFSSHYWDISCTSFYYFIKNSGSVSTSMSCPQCSTGAFTDTSLRNHPSRGAHKPSRMVITTGNKLTAILTFNCN